MAGSGGVAPRMRSEALSAIIMVAALRLAESMRRHDRGVDHAQAFEAVHAQLVVDHGQRIARPAPCGRCRSGWNVVVPRSLGGAQQLVVALHARAREILVVVIGLAAAST